MKTLKQKLFDVIMQTCTILMVIDCFKSWLKQIMVDNIFK